MSITPAIRIRLLAPADAASFWALRLEALQREPGAFGASEDEHRATTEEDAAARLSSEDGWVFGVFADDRLRGMAGLLRDRRRKARHRASIWGVYLGAELRGRGVGHQLLEAVVSHARTVHGLERL